jgi:hypothetical protein
MFPLIPWTCRHPCSPSSLGLSVAHLLEFSWIPSIRDEFVDIWISPSSLGLSITHLLDLLEFSWIRDEFVGNLWVSGFLRGLQENAKGFSRPFQGLAWRRSDGRTAQWSIPLVYPPGPLRGKPPSASLLGARRSLPLAPLPSAHCRLFARSLPITRL